MTLVNVKMSINFETIMGYICPCSNKDESSCNVTEGPEICNGYWQVDRPPDCPLHIEVARPFTRQN